MCVMRVFSLAVGSEIARSFVGFWNRCSLLFLRCFARVSVGTVHVCACCMSLTLPFVLVSGVGIGVLMFALL